MIYRYKADTLYFRLLSIDVKYLIVFCLPIGCMAQGTVFTKSAYFKSEGGACIVEFPCRRFFLLRVGTKTGGKQYVHEIFQNLFSIPV